jgi:hypothetical protein
VDLFYFHCCQAVAALGEPDMRRLGADGTIVTKVVFVRSSAGSGEEFSFLFFLLFFLSFFLSSLSFNVYDQGI